MFPLDPLIRLFRAFPVTSRSFAPESAIYLTPSRVRCAASAALERIVRPFTSTL